MSTAELERELARWRAPAEELPPSEAVRLTVEEALAYRNEGNFPDEEGRSLRLVLLVDDDGPEAVAIKRLAFEPDFHDAPTWRKEGSKSVNVVPLRRGRRAASESLPWWEQPGIRELEQEWEAFGTVEGIPVPGDYRSFVFKTVVALRAAGKRIDASAIADSIERWVPKEEADRIRSALEGRGPDGPGREER